VLVAGLDTSAGVAPHYDVDVRLPQGNRATKVTRRRIDRVSIDVDE
jgi:hypothetical protein